MGDSLFRLKTIIYVVLGFLLIFSAYKLNEDTVTEISIRGKFNQKAKELNLTKYSDYEGAELYENGIVEGIDSFYNVYILDDSVIAKYKEENNLGVILNGIKPIVEAPLLSKSNEILSVLELKGVKVEEKELPMSTALIMYITNGGLEAKINTIDATLGGIKDLKFIRIDSNGINGVYIDSEKGEYILPLLSEDITIKLGMENYKPYEVSDFINNVSMLKN